MNSNDLHDLVLSLLTAELDSKGRHVYSDAAAAAAVANMTRAEQLAIVADWEQRHPL